MSKTRRLIIATVIALGAATTAAPAFAATPTTDSASAGLSIQITSVASSIWDW